MSRRHQYSRHFFAGLLNVVLGVREPYREREDGGHMRLGSFEDSSQTLKALTCQAKALGPRPRSSGKSHGGFKNRRVTGSK